MAFERKAPLARADWGEQLEDPEDARIWESNWDDEDVKDSFSKTLGAQLAQRRPSEA